MPLRSLQLETPSVHVPTQSRQHGILRPGAPPPGTCSIGRTLICVLIQQPVNLNQAGASTPAFFLGDSLTSAR